MPRLVPDDTARELRSVWLGARGLMRWPVDARFEAWGLALVLTPFVFIAAAFIVPFPAAVLVLALVAGRWVGRVLPEQRLQKNLLLGVLVVTLLYTGVNVAGIHALWSPTHWLVCLPLAPVVSALLTRRIMRNVEPNRPLGYQARVLFGRATAPRRRRDVAELAVIDQPLAAADDSDPDPLDLDLFRTRLSFRKPVSLRKAPRPTTRES